MAFGLFANTAAMIIPGIMAVYVRYRPEVDAHPQDDRQLCPCNIGLHWRTLSGAITEDGDPWKPHA
jgi:hypothetical protein